MNVFFSKTGGQSRTGITDSRDKDTFRRNILLVSYFCVLVVQVRIYHLETLSDSTERVNMADLIRLFVHSSYALSLSDQKNNGQASAYPLTDSVMPFPFPTCPFEKIFSGRTKNPRWHAR